MVISVIQTVREVLCSGIVNYLGTAPWVSDKYTLPFSTSDYDGAVTYEFEAVGFGTVQLVGDFLEGDITIGMTGDMANPERVRGTISPANVSNGFKIAIYPASAAYATRIITTQRGALKTVIEIPIVFGGSTNNLDAEQPFNWSYIDIVSTSWVQVGSPWYFDAALYGDVIKKIEFHAWGAKVTPAIYQPGDRNSHYLQIALVNSDNQIVMSHKIYWQFFVDEGIPDVSTITYNAALPTDTYRVMARWVDEDLAVTSPFAKVYRVILNVFVESLTKAEVPWCIVGKTVGDVSEFVNKRRVRIDPAMYPTGNTSFWLKTGFDGRRITAGLVDCNLQNNGLDGAWATLARNHCEAAGAAEFLPLFQSSEAIFPPIKRNYVGTVEQFGSTAGVLVSCLCVRVGTPPTLPKTYTARIPIELADRYLRVSWLDVDFKRTTFTYDPDDHDGDPELLLEVNQIGAGQLMASYCRVLDSDDVEVGGGWITGRGMHRIAFTPNATKDTYRIKLTAVDAAEAQYTSVNVRGLICHASNPSKTRVYFPLVQASVLEASESDSAECATSQSDAAWTVPDGGGCNIWPIGTGVYSTIPSGNAIRIEYFLVSDGTHEVQAALYNKTLDAVVSSSIAAHTSATPDYYCVEFAADAENFLLDSDYELRLKGASGQGKVIAARGSIKLDPYGAADIYYRNGHVGNDYPETEPSQMYQDQVLWLPSEMGGNPKFYHEATCNPKAGVNYSNMVAEIPDQLDLGYPDDPTLTFDTTRERKRSGPHTNTFDMLGFSAITSYDAGYGMMSFLVQKLARSAECAGVTAAIDAATMLVTGTGRGVFCTKWRVIDTADDSVMDSGTGENASFSFTGQYGHTYQLQFAADDDVFSEESCTFTFTGGGGGSEVVYACRWRGGWFGIERPRQSKAFRYGRLVTDRTGFKVRLYTVDHRNSTVQEPEYLGEFSADARIPTQKKANLLHYDIRFPDDDDPASVMELTNFDIPISER